MEIWGELSLPSDPLALSDSNMFESIDDSEHEQYEDDFELDEQRLVNHALNSYVCNAAKALESVLSEALGKYPLIVLDEQANNGDSMKANSKQTTHRKDDWKFRNSISSSLFGESFQSATNDLEIWEEAELDEEISSIEEEVERIQQNKYVIETTVPYSPRSDSPSHDLFFEEYRDFLPDPDEIADASSDCSALSSPIPSPLSTPISPQSPVPSTPPTTEDNSSNHHDSSAHASGSSCEEDDIATPSNSVPSSPATSNISTATTTEEHKATTKRRTEQETPQPREKRVRKTKNKSIAITASLSLTVIENSADSPSGKTWTPTRRRKSKKRTTTPKKKLEEIFKSEQVLKIKSVEGDEVDVNVDIGDASDFTNY